MQLDEVMRILTSFEREGLEYVLVGGTVLNVHGLIRTTEDVDVFIRPTAENVERLRRALRAVYNDPDVDEISTEDLLGDYPAQSPSRSMMAVNSLCIPDLLQFG